MKDGGWVPPGHQWIMDASAYLVGYLHQVPVLLVPCIEGRTENMPFLQQAVTWGSTSYRFMSRAGAQVKHCPFLA